MKIYSENLFQKTRSVAKKSTGSILWMLLVGLVLATGCEKLKNLRTGIEEGGLSEPQQIMPNEPILVAKGVFYSGDYPEGGVLQVITTPAAWDTLLNSIPANNIVADFVETIIDFSAYQAIVVIDEQHGSGGWTIDITDVKEYSDSIVVNYTNLSKGNLSSVITRPFHIVKIPLSSKQIFFQYEN